MPAVADLRGLGCALGGPLSEATATITAHDLDARMGCEPGRDGATLPVRQKVDGASTFEIADDRAIALALEPGENVDANRADVGWRRCRAPAQEAQQRVNAHRHGQAFDKPLPGPAAQREGDGVGEDVEARRSTRVSLDEIMSKAFREHPALAGGVAASESPCRQSDPEASTMGREIAKGSFIAAMDRGRPETARWTITRR